MDFDPILSFLQGWAFLLAVFGLALAFAMAKGRQNIINLIAGLYLAFLLYQLFPWKDIIADKAGSGRTEAMALLALFAALTVLATWLFSRLMPREWLEGTFEALGKKILLALAAMVLVMTLSIHYLPVDALISTGTPLPAFLLTDNLSYAWLLLPLAVLFLI